MRVLVIEPCYVNFGGYFRAVPMCQALSRKNIEVDLLVSSNSNFKLFIKKSKISENFCQYELTRIRITPYLNGRLIRAVIAIFFGMFKKYDIIHACVPTQLESIIPAFFLKLIGKKVVIDWDDYWMGSPIFEANNIIKKYITFCEKNSPNFFKNFVVVSDFLANKAKEWGATKVLKIINGVVPDQIELRDKESSFTALKLNKNKKYLLCIGNTYSRDRTFRLFQAFEKIRRLDQGIMLICNFNLSKKIKEQNLERMISPDSLENTIDIGYLNQRDLEHCLSICSATIFLQGETEDELACFPARIGTYLCGESVIIMNDTGSEAVNTLRKYGCAIIEKDISLLAEKTVEFLNDIDLQEKMRKNVLFAKKDMSWDNIIGDLIGFYREIIKKKDV
jgi:glycosyltransferase involved in cell wall biosynthesis